MARVLATRRCGKPGLLSLEGQQKPPTYVLKQGKAPGWVKANRPARPKKERKKRSHGFARRLEEPTHPVEHATASCPDCGIPLIGGRVRGRRQVISIPRVTEHLVFERTCPKCLKRWPPEPELKERFHQHQALAAWS